MTLLSCCSCINRVENATCQDGGRQVEQVEVVVEVGDVKGIHDVDGAMRSDGHNHDVQQEAEKVEVAHGVRHLCAKDVV